MGNIIDLTISYPDFKLNDLIDPEQFDTNNSEIVTKVNQVITESNAQDDRITAVETGKANQSTTYTKTEVDTLNTATRNQIKAITGKVNWNDVPVKTLEQLNVRDGELTTEITNMKGSGWTIGHTIKGSYDLSNQANTNATNAVNTANTANTTASSANTKADNAVSTTNTANTNATNAVTIANNAMTKATQVETDFNTMKPQLDQALFDVNGAVAEVANKVDQQQLDYAVAQFVQGSIPDGSIGLIKLASDVQTKINEGGTFVDPGTGIRYKWVIQGGLLGYVEAI